MTRVMTVTLESIWARIHILELDKRDDVIEDVECARWDPQPYIHDETGVRLFEEIGRRCHIAAAEQGQDVPDALAVTMPGTLLNSSTIVTSSRLNIRQQLDAVAVLRAQVDRPARVFHDMPCMVMGYEAQHAGNQNSFAYVNLDEGVGSVLFIDGSPYRGAGVAGSLGRMVVEPDGVYFPEISARGTLEAYVGRPWISENCVALWSAEQGKRGGPSANESTKFRRALRAAAKGRRRELTCAQISEGLRAEDPIARTATSTAARYAGFGINALLAIVHPHKLVLGGSLCAELPGFADEVELHTRMYSWPNAWNKVEFLHTEDSRRDQRVGAARLYRIESENA